jgi:hypothetical protein
MKSIGTCAVAMGVVLAAVGMTDALTTPLRALSLFAPYIDNDLGNRFWDFGGMVSIGRVLAVDVGGVRRMDGRGGPRGRHAHHFLLFVVR